MKVFIIAAISADGFIARDPHEFPDWTSKEDKKSFADLTKNAVLIFGGNTFRTIGRPLPGRRNIVYSRSLIVDGVETTQKSPEKLVAMLQNDGHNEVAICGGGTIYSMFLKAGLVTDIYLTLAPLLFGAGVALLDTAVDTKLKLEKQSMLNPDTILLHYKVI